MRSQTDMEYGPIPMEKNIKDNGQMEKKMVQEFILIVLPQLKMDKPHFEFI